jgi:hypothetical protein
VIDVIGHIGYVFIAAGILGLGLKHKWGWIARFIGEMIWVGIGIHMGMSSIWFWGSIFLVMDVCGYIVWRGDETTIQQH